MGKTITIEEEDWLCGEQFTQGDVNALQELGRRSCRKNALFTEVGSWKGFSAFLLATVLRGNGVLYAVDHWRGSKDSWMEVAATKEDIYSIFKNTLIQLGYWDVVQPMIMDSEAAARIFADGILDLVFIDANHSYDSIKQDILLWLPKVKPGGILCGHDCEGYYAQYTGSLKLAIDSGYQTVEYLHIIDSPPSGIHPGVIMAVHDLLSGYQIMPDSKVWYYVKGVNYEGSGIEYSGNP